MSRNYEPARLSVTDLDDEYEDDEPQVSGPQRPPLPTRVVAAPDAEPAPTRGGNNLAMILGIVGFGAVAALVLVAMIVNNMNKQVAPPAQGRGGSSTGGSPGVATPETGPAVGMIAPDFTAQSIDGQTIRLSDYRGKQAVWLNFWASWCGPCKQEMPAMQEIHQANKNKDFVMLGFDVREELPVIQGFVKDRFTWTFLVEPSGATSDRYYVYGIPTHVFINKQGIITNLMASGLPKQVMEAEIQKMLKE